MPTRQRSAAACNLIFQWRLSGRLQPDLLLVAERPQQPALLQQGDRVRQHKNVLHNCTLVYYFLRTLTGDAYETEECGRLQPDLPSVAEWPQQPALLQQAARARPHKKFAVHLHVSVLFLAYTHQGCLRDRGV